MKVRHSVIVITYNQESLIGECLDSILNQSVIPYEVIVCDDCSSDRTWAIVEQYTERYSNILKPFRNQQNKGVFGNFNQAFRLASGDFVNFVSGDDLLPEGILQAYTEYIEKHGLKCDDVFSIYTDTLVLHPDGKMSELNNFCLRSTDPARLILMNSWYIWITGLSIGLMRKLPPLRENIGYKADWLFNLERVLVTDRHYYLDQFGYIYREGVGVTVASRQISLFESRMKVLSIMNEHYPALFDRTVRFFLSFETAYLAYLIRPTVGRYWRMFLARCRVKDIPKGSLYRGNFKILIPISIKNIIRRLIR